MAAKPRYKPAIINITYTEGDTGDIVLWYSDVIDLTNREVFMEVRDEDNNIIFSKDSALSEILIEDRFAEEENSDYIPGDSGNTFIGYAITIIMLVEDTKHHDSATTVWEIEMYGPSSEDVYTITKGKFVITKEIAEHA